MATKSTISIEERLNRAQVAIDNAISDADIKAALVPFGYDETRLLEGKSLYEKALSLHQAQQREYGEQFGATKLLTETWDKAYLEYMNALKIARIALRDKFSKWQALALEGRRKESFSGWKDQAQQFYANALTDTEIVSAMSRFGFNQERLTVGQNLVQQVADANAEQEKEKGEAQDATKKRDAALDELDQWMSDFKVVALIALQENPQWIEKLGLATIE